MGVGDYESLSFLASLKFCRRFASSPGIDAHSAQIGNRAFATQESFEVSGSSFSDFFDIL